MRSGGDVLGVCKQVAKLAEDLVARVKDASGASTSGSDLEGAKCPQPPSTSTSGVMD